MNPLRTSILIACFVVASGCGTDPQAGREAEQLRENPDKTMKKPPRTKPDPGSHANVNRVTTPPPRPRATPPVEPPVDLAAACEERAKWLRARADRTFRVKVATPFVVAGNLGRRGLDYNLRRGVLKPAKALYASYFRKRPKHPITIILLKDFKTYAYWANKLFGDAQVPYYGYFKPQLRTMIMNIGPGIGTLYHELTHALMAVDFPQVPDWFNEGLGSLHEGSYVTRRRLVGVTNWRYPALRRALNAGKLRSLRELITRDDFYTYRTGMNYAQARFFVQFLQQKRILRKFYAYFRDHPGKDLGVAAVEHIFGYNLETVDREYRRYLKRLRYRR